jgi:hypothetical protein
VMRWLSLTLSATQRFQQIASINSGLTKVTLPTKISPLLYKHQAEINRAISETTIY